MGIAAAEGTSLVILCGRPNSNGEKLVVKGMSKLSKNSIDLVDESGEFG